MTWPGKATKSSKRQLSPSLFLLAGGGGGASRCHLCEQGVFTLEVHSSITALVLVKSYCFQCQPVLVFRKTKACAVYFNTQAFRHCSTGSLRYPGLQMMRALLSSRSSPNLQTLLIILPDSLICLDVRAEFGPFYK